MPSDLFHSHPLAAAMSPEEVPSVLEFDPFSPLPDVSLNTIFPDQQQPIPTPISRIPNPRPASLAPPSHFPSLSSGYAAGQLRRTISCGAYVYENPWFSFQPRYGRSISRYCLVNLAKIRTERCSAEERKEKIERYRAKRCRRNFNKTIKYACRKTSADSRPRVRGRFARNDEVRGMPGSASYTSRDDALV